ncbi:unnamed protein product [Ectocarpus sp. 12 AP-2014]
MCSRVISRRTEYLSRRNASSVYRAIYIRFRTPPWLEHEKRDHNFTRYSWHVRGAQHPSSRNCVRLSVCRSGTLIICVASKVVSQRNHSSSSDPHARAKLGVPHSNCPRRGLAF